MADALGSLVISLIAETATFRTEMERASASVTSTATTVESASKQMSSSLSRMDAGLATLGVSFKSLLGFAAGAGFGEIIKSSLEATVEIGHLAEKAGMTVEAFSSLTAAAKLSKTPIEDVAAASDKFSKNLAGAQDGTGKTADALRALGFSAQDAARFLAQPATGLFELGKRLNEFGTDGNKVAAVLDLMGKGGANLLPFLRELGEQTGLTAKIFQDQVDTAKAATDALTRIQSASSAAGRTMAIELAPTVTGIANAFLTLNTGGKDSIGLFTALGEVARVAALGILAAWTGLQNIGGTLVAVGKAIYDVAHGDVAKAQADIDAGAAANTARVRTLADAYGELQKTSPLLSFLAGRHVEAAAAAKTHSDRTIDLAASMKAATVPAADFLNNLQRQVDTFGLSAGALIRYNAALLGLAPSVVQPYIDELDALNRAVDAQKSAVKEAGEEWKAFVARQQAAAESIQETDKWFNDLYESLKRDTATMALSNAERQKTIALLELESRTADKTTAGYQAQRDALIAAFDNKALAQGAVDAAKESADAWAQTGKSIERALTDALFTGFQNGKKFGDQLIDILKASFARLVLSPTINATLGAGGLGGLFSSGANASTGGGSLSILSGLGGLSSGFNALGDIGFAAADFSQLVGSGIGIFQSASTAFAGLGSTIAAALPAVGALAIGAYALYQMFSQAPGGPKSGGFGQSGSGLSRFYTPNDNDAAMVTLATSTAEAYTSTLIALGGKGNANFGFGFDTDPKGTAQDRITVGATVNGQSAYSVLNQNVGRGDSSTAQASLETESKRALLAALQASDFPSALAKILNSATAGSATSDQITRILSFATAYKTIADVLARNPVDDALKAIATSSLTASGALQGQASALREMVKAFDGSTAQVNALSSATQQFYAAEVALIAQTRQVSSALSTMFADTIKSFTLQTLDNKGKNEFYREDESRLREQLASATDPEEIRSITEAIVADFNAAFGLLSDVDKAAQLNDYKAGLAAVQAAAQERLKAVEETTKATVSTLLPLIQQAILDGATKTQTAADTMQTAADTMAGAAGRAIDIVFTANIPGTAEVNG